MEELIVAINQHFINPKREDSFDTTIYLEKEKEQIIESYYEGHTAPYFSQNGNDVEKQAEEYYNQTYQNK